MPTIVEVAFSYHRPFPADELAAVGLHVDSHAVRHQIVVGHLEVGGTVALHRIGGVEVLRERPLPVAV